MAETADNSPELSMALARRPAWRRAAWAVLGAGALALAAAVLAAGLWGGGRAGAQASVPSFISSHDLDCSVSAIQVRSTARFQWSPECRSILFEESASFVGFTVSERLLYRIVVNNSREARSGNIRSANNFITLYSSGGSRIAQSDGSANSANLTFKYNSEILMVLDPGTYYAEVASVTSGREFEFSLYPLPSDDCKGGLDLGSAASADWVASCVAVTENARAHFYDLTLEEEAILDIRLGLTEGSAGGVLRLLDSNWNLLAMPRPEEPERLFVVAPSGTYRLEVAAPRGSAGGFQLDSALLGTASTGIFRPLVGGIQIGYRGGSCSLGVPATVRHSEGEFRGVITNSHCTDQRGSQDNTQLQQGGENVTPPVTRTRSSTGEVTDVIGEIAESTLLDWESDASQFYSTLDRLGCAPSCQYSDAAFFVLERDIGSDNAIARPERVNSQTPRQMAANASSQAHLALDRSRPTFEVVGIGEARLGDTVHKVGTTTGWTSGTVTHVCRDLLVRYGSDESKLICQDRFAASNGTVVSGSGDSGSPVFRCVTAAGADDPSCRANRVVIVGILHSGASDACVAGGRCYGSDANYSPINTILAEFNTRLPEGEACWIFGTSEQCHVPVQPQPVSNCFPEELNLGEARRGSWRSSCAAVGSFGSGAARYYRLQLEEETDLHVNFSGNASVTLISMHDFSFGDELGEVSPGAIRRPNLAAGSYMLEVVGPSNGRFIIVAAEDGAVPELEEPPQETPPPAVARSFNPSACPVQQITLPTAATFGWAPACSATEFSQSSAHFSRFVVTEGGEYRISAWSEEMHLITLLNEHQEDLGRSSSPNAAGEYTFSMQTELTKALEPGSYLLEVISFDDAPGRQFTLNIQPAPAAAAVGAAVPPAAPASTGTITPVGWLLAGGVAAVLAAVIITAIVVSARYKGIAAPAVEAPSQVVPPPPDLDAPQPAPKPAPRTYAGNLPPAPAPPGRRPGGE